MHRDQLGEPAEVLGSGGEVELVSGTVRASEPEPVELQDALEMGEQHLDLLPLSPGGVVGLGRGDVPCMSRAPSWMERGILRAGVLGQHCGLSEQASQSTLLAR